MIGAQYNLLTNADVLYGTKVCQCVTPLGLKGLTRILCSLV